MQIDVNLMRENIIEQWRLANVDDTYTFYYDESNNIRKLHLTESGLNVGKTSNFVLAGILHKGQEHNARFEFLIDTLQLQKTTKELKLKHIAKGGVDNLLASNKLGILLKWLLDNDFYVHYFNLNVFYWSIVDIVDSIIDNLDFENKQFFIPAHMLIKSDLYKVIISDEENFLAALRDFEYPNIKPERVDEFSKYLVYFVRLNSKVLRKDRKFLLNKFMEGATKCSELFFIMNEKDHVLIDNFFVFYLRNTCLFKNSVHIFDSEKEIQAIFEKYELVDKGKAINSYSFADSQSMVEIQVSDVLAGFLSKYFTFISETDVNELKVLKSKLSCIQRENLGLLKSLIDKSNDLSEGFFYRTVSEDEYFKSDFFLHS